MIKMCVRRVFSAVKDMAEEKQKVFCAVVVVFEDWAF